MLSKTYIALTNKIFIFFLTFFSLSIFSLEAQNDFSGLWEGEYSYNNGQPQGFVTELYFHVTNDNKLNGYGASYPQVGNSSGLKYTKWRIKGSVTDQGLRYKVTSIYHYKGNERICQAECYFKRINGTDEYVLDGNCYPTGYAFEPDGTTLVKSFNCPDVEIRLIQKNVPSEVISDDEIEQLEEAYSDFDKPNAPETTPEPPAVIETPKVEVPEPAPEVEKPEEVTTTTTKTQSSSSSITSSKRKRYKSSIKVKRQGSKKAMRLQRRLQRSYNRSKSYSRTDCPRW